MKKASIFIAGHKGMVGSSILRALDKYDNNIILAEKSSLNLLDQYDVNNFIKNNNIDEIYLAAAKVGGIHANNEYPAQFIYENLMIQCNIINAAHLNNINKILFLGSSCIYPRSIDHPIKENDLLTGKLEKTNEPYAIAKIAGIKLCESFNRQYSRDYRSVMPTNLYGPNDNFHLENSHVIPALIKKFHYAKLNSEPHVVIWGSGNQMREFLHVDDMADACIHIMNLEKGTYHSLTEPMNSHVNVGSGYDCKIKDLAEKISIIVGYNGDIKFDTTKPDGTKRKLMDVSLINKTGWSQKISFDEGLLSTYDWFKRNYKNTRER